MINWNLHLIHGFDELWSMIRIGLSNLLGADELLHCSDHIVLGHPIRRISINDSCKTISDDQHLLFKNQHIVMDFGCVDGIKGNEVAKLLEFPLVCTTTSLEVFHLCANA